LACLQNSALDLSGFEEGSVIGQSDGGSTQIYQRRTDAALVVVKSISLSAVIERCQIEREIENLLNLRHPLIVPLIGCAVPVECDGQWELKTVRQYASGVSLADVLSAPASWWTATAKAKVVVGIALALRFAHGLGLLHGAVKAENILFDADRGIQIADFSAIRLESGAVDPFSGANWSPSADVCAFTSLLSEIAVGGAAIRSIGGVDRRPIPEFVWRIIEEGQSFVDIVDRLKANRFEILGGVDSEEVSAFVALVESAEQSKKWD
jgi:serine/threonine protein kinase